MNANLQNGALAQCQDKTQNHIQSGTLQFQDCKIEDSKLESVNNNNSEKPEEVTTAVARENEENSFKGERIFEEPKRGMKREEGREPDRDDDRKRRRSRSRSRSPRRERRGNSSGRREPGMENDRMVYISNVPYDIRWMELKDMIREKAGEVAFVEMLETPDGKSKGCAVIEFKDKESAKKCVEVMHRMPLKDRYVVCKEIRDPAAFFRKVKEDIGVDFLANRSGFGSSRRGGGGGGGRDMGGPRMGMGGGGGGRMMQMETYGLSPNFLQQLGIDGPLCNRVFVANLPYNVQSGKIYEIFNLCGNVKSVDLHLDKEGKSKGLAVVEFSHPIEAVQSISMLNNKRLNDRSLTVKMDKFEKTQEVRRPGELPQGLREVGMGLGANGAPLTNIASLLGQVASSPQPAPIMPQPAMNFPQQQGNNNFGGGNSMMQGGGGMGNQGAGFYGGGVGGGAIGSMMGGGAGSGSGYGNNQGGYSSGPGTGNMNPMGGGNMNAPMGGGGGSMGGGGGGGPFSGYTGSSSGPMDVGGYSSNQQRSMMGGNESAYGGSVNNDRMRDDRMRDFDGPLGGNMGGGGRAMSNPMGGGMGGGSMSSGMGAGPGRHQQPSRTIVIKNLPMDYTWQMVRERLRPFGEIEFADIIATGVAKVRFKNVVDADRAWSSLSGMSVEGRLISVDFD